MTDPDSQRILDGIVDRSLPKPEWTHEAHLRACHAALADRAPTEALEFLRATIRSYNEATGVANTPTSGYHETITRYYVAAVAGLGAVSIEAVLTSSSTEREAPLRHWRTSRLFSPAARADWVEPDRLPLPWPLTPGVDT